MPVSSIRSYVLDLTRVARCGVCRLVFFQAEDGIRYLVRSRGLGDGYKRQALGGGWDPAAPPESARPELSDRTGSATDPAPPPGCLLYTSDAAAARSSVDLGGRRIIKKKKESHHLGVRSSCTA